MKLTVKLVQVLTTSYDDIRPTIVFVDAGMGGAIVDRCRQLGYSNVVEVNFGSQPPDLHSANMRSYMWSRLRDWLECRWRRSFPQLEIDLTGRPGKRDAG